MSLEVREILISGNRFSDAVARAGVPSAGQVSVTAPANGELKLPGESRISLLAELPIAKNPADREELKILMGEAFALDERIKSFALARFAEQRADREAQLEEARDAVREQQQVLKDLAAKLHEDGQWFIRLDNERRMLSNAAQVAEQERQGMSRFASKREIAAAEKRVVDANEKMHAAEDKAATAGQLLNSLKIVIIPQENKKLVALVEAETEIAAQLEGRDPFWNGLDLSSARFAPPNGWARQGPDRPLDCERARLPRVSGLSLFFGDG